jgi:hypothetical protein
MLTVLCKSSERICANLDGKLLGPALTTKTQIVVESASRRLREVVALFGAVERRCGGKHIQVLYYIYLALCML